jgi:DNA-binding transcriptional ArsR family regulator
MPEKLNQLFAALADPTRRAILAALMSGERPVSELARPFKMSLPGFMKHLGILEDAGLLIRAKRGRVVQCRVAAAPMKEAADWLAHYQRFWESRLDALAVYLDEQEEPRSWTPPRKRNLHRSPSAARSRSRRRKSGAP